jgi:hypothetical protein
LEKIAMILTVVMKLQQQFIIVTLIEGGGLTQQLPVKRRISVAILMHMVIGATPLLRGAEKVHAKNFINWENGQGLPDKDKIRNSYASLAHPESQGANISRAD